eukprot:COSAG04_NODE_3306_length_2950_cov_2.006664_2_plen_109_part_00
MRAGSAATRCLNLSLQVGILLGLLHSYVLQLFDEGSANVSGANCVDLDANQSGVQNVPTPGNFYVNLPPLFLGHFSPIFARFSPFFRRSLRLARKIQETGTKTRKNGP